jgi:hypothetical protein
MTLSEEMLALLSDLRATGLPMNEMLFQQRVLQTLQKLASRIDVLAERSLEHSVER